MLKRQVIGVAVVSLAVGVLAAGPAEAAGNTFSGTITGPDVAPGSIKVEAIAVNNSNVLSSAKVNGDGNFVVTNIKKSTYRIRFSAKTGDQNRVWYWREDATKKGTPKLLEGTIVGTGVKNAGVIKFGSITGTISKEDLTTGDLTPRISVASGVTGNWSAKTIANASRYHVQDHAATSGSSYTIAFLPYRDDYVISFSDTAKNYQTDWYSTAVNLGGKEDVGSASKVAIGDANDQKTTVNFTFKRAYALSGSVKGDADGGKYDSEKHRDGQLISAAVSPTHSVEVLRTNGSVFASTYVNGLGNYELKGLRRDEAYMVRFVGTSGRSRFLTEYYCKADTLTETIDGIWCDSDLTNGDYVEKYYANTYSGNRQVVKVDLAATTSVPLDQVTLDIGRKISGKVTFATGKRKPRRSVAVRAYNDSGWASRWSYTDAKGNYTIGGLAPGSYKIETNFDGFKKKEKKRRYHNGKKGGATSSSKAKWVNVTNGNVKIPNLYSDS